jgi:ABC-type Zn uptake system ZnuABC Zn-binding protein ZnuA
MSRRIVTAVAGVMSVVLLAACSEERSVASPGSPATAGVSDPAVAQVAAFSCPAAADAGGLGPGPGPGPGPAAKLQVVTTVAPITSIVANVAGDRAEVHGVIPEGEDSHTYEPKPSVAALLAQADVVFVNGLQLEDPTRELAEANARDTAQVVELGNLTLTPEQYLYDFSFPRDAGKPNPHLWTNPPMARCYAELAASVLAGADPANAGAYQANAAAFGAKVDELDRLMVEATGTIGAADRELLTYHDAYAYFAAHYGWTVIGAVQVSDFADPTPKEVAGLITQIKAEQVPVVFGSEVFPSPVLAQIADEAGARYIDELRDDDLPGAPGDRVHSYLGLMQFDFVTMVANLGGDASQLERFDPSGVVPDRAEYPQ